jgi:transcriptional regulator with XRE-family HTH domain
MENETPTDQDPWTLGDRLRKARELAGYKYQILKFCEKVDISDNSLRRYEDDVIVPRGHVFVAWSQVTGMSVEWLKTGHLLASDARRLASQHPADDNGHHSVSRTKRPSRRTTRQYRDHQRRTLRPPVAA